MKFHLQNHRGVRVLKMKDWFIDKLSDLDDMVVVYKDIEVDNDFGYEWDELISLEVGGEVYEMRLIVETSSRDISVSICTGTVYRCHVGMHYQS